MGELGRTQRPQLAQATKRLACVGADPSDQLGHARAIATGDGDDGEAVVIEYLLDRLVLVVAESLKHHHAAASVAVGQEELGHHFVCATEIEELDVGEVEQGRCAIGLGERRLDAVANRGAGRPSDEVAVRGRGGLTQEGADPDSLDHRDSVSGAGMVICTWAPGKNGRCSLNGTSSSHTGTIASRAVPLRIEILPSHLSRNGLICRNP